VGESSSQKTPSNSHTNQQKEARLNHTRSPQNQATTDKTSGRITPQRSLQTRTKIVKDEREKHTQEAYKPPKSRKNSRQQLISYKPPKRAVKSGKTGKQLPTKEAPKRTSKIEQKRTNRKLREEANKSGDQSPKSRQQERNRAFIAAQCSLYRQKSTKVTERT
jgi:hypothetical protein